MGITVLNILDLGKLASGKLPDIYWDIDLTGSELKVLRYVYDNCLRLYETVKVYPRAKDGSPRFWRGKEKMADDLGLSYPTFRNAVRKLHKLGLVSSMDVEDDETAAYCIGLIPDFINAVFSQTEKSFRSHSLIVIGKIIYNKFTVSVIEKKIKEIENNPSFSKEKERHVGGVCKNSNVLSESMENPAHSDMGNQKLVYVRKPIIQRTPIVKPRNPVCISPIENRLEAYKKKLKELHHILTPDDKETLEICKYYEYKCRCALNSSGFKALGKDYMEHKNWKFLQRIKTMCRENGWDYKVFIDSQFDRVRFYTRKQLYPYLNQFFSEGAIKYYHNYIKDYKEKNSVTGKAKIKTANVQTFVEQVADKVVGDCERIAEYMKVAPKRRVNQGLTLQQIKMSYLSEHWMGLSPEYLASIPWIEVYLLNLPQEPFVVDLCGSIQKIQKSPKMSETVISIVNSVEEQMNIPPTMLL